MRNTPIAPTGRRLLSQTAEHALRAVLYLAGRPARGYVPAGEVAAAIGTPPNYTSKTLRQLARKGLLHSVRGPQGGFALAVEPESLSVSRLIDAVDEVAETPGMCLLGDRPCDPERPCAAHRRWTEVKESAHAVLERTTIADFLADTGASETFTLPHEQREHLEV